MIYIVKYPSGYIGGIALVCADNIAEALIIANEKLAKEPMANIEKPLDLSDIEAVEITLGEVQVLANGDY